MKIKQIPEDFIVEESIKLNIYKEKKDYSVIRLTKKSWETFQIIGLISKKLNLKQKFIGFAGLKDKNAITTQHISLYKVSKDKIKNLGIKDVKTEFVGYSKNRINLGDLDGNNFIITIRDIEKKFKIPKKMQLENYFDDQRFGADANTHLVGRALVKRNFEKACEILKLNHSKNYIYELRKQPKRLLRFYIASYQSYLWNKILCKIISNKKDPVKYPYNLGYLFFSKKRIKTFKIPLINFDTRPNKYAEWIMNEEKINMEDFIFRELPELVTESHDRSAFVDVKNIKHSFEKDELNPAKLKLKISFFLPKGSYATMLIKKIESIYSK